MFDITKINLGQINAKEEKDLLIAVAALAAAYAVVGNLIHSNFGAIPEAFCIAIITIGISIVVHEMAHKYTAIKYGLQSHFEKDNMMLAAGLVFAIMGTFFAAPGAAMVYGNPNRNQLGWIKAAGSISNLLLCIPFGMMMAYGLIANGSLIAMIGIAGVTINAYLAAFNQIPFGVLDGAAVMPWNWKIWLSIILIAIGIIVVLPFIVHIIG